MRALVTGATGFAGSYIAEELLRRGHSVRALVRATSDTAHLEGIGAELAVGDMTDAPALERACQGMDWVFHAAALVGAYGDWEHFLEVGVRGTERLIAAAEKAGVERFVHLSSMTVYGTRPGGRTFSEDTPFDLNPESWNHYVREKVFSELAVWKAHDAGRINATTVRPSIIVGERDRNFVPRALKVMRFPVGGLAGSGNNRVACVVVDELAGATVDAAECDIAAGRAYNLSGRAPITQRRVLDIVARELGIHRRRISVPMPYRLAHGFSGALETAWSAAGMTDEPYFNRFSMVLLGQDYDIDCRRAEQELGWRGDASYEDAIVAAVRYHRG